MSNPILSFTDEYLTAFRAAILRDEQTVHLPDRDVTFSSMHDLYQAEALLRLVRDRRIVPSEPEVPWTSARVFAFMFALYGTVLVGVAVFGWYIQDAQQSFLAAGFATGCWGISWMAWRDL